MNTSEIELDVMCEALTELDFYSRFIFISFNIHDLKLHEGETMPDLTIIQNKCNEIRPLVYSKYALKYLRKKRNELLKECDYLALPDYPHENPEIRTAWKIYRQQLRDLPTNTDSIKNISLNDQNELIGVVWPTPPS